MSEPFVMQFTTNLVKNIPNMGNKCKNNQSRYITHFLLTFMIMDVHMTNCDNYLKSEKLLQ